MNGKHLKTLGLSLLALVGVLAVSASAAQANYVITKGGSSVASAEFNATIATGKLLVPNLGLIIECTNGGTGTVSTKVNGTKLEGEAKATFSGCKDITEFGNVCTVAGKADGVGSGKITAAGKGEAVMTEKKVGANIWVTASSGEFADVVYSGAECPLTEIDGKVKGSVKILVKEASKEMTTHSVELVEQSLEYGENGPATLHNGTGGNLTGSVTEISNAATKVDLTGTL